MERLVEIFHFVSSYKAVGQNTIEVSINLNLVISFNRAWVSQVDSYMLGPLEEGHDNQVLHLFFHLDQFSSFYTSPHALLAFCIFTAHKRQAHVVKKDARSKQNHQTNLQTNLQLELLFEEFKIAFLLSVCLFFECLFIKRETNSC